MTFNSWHFIVHLQQFTFNSSPLTLIFNSWYFDFQQLICQRLSINSGPSKYEQSKSILFKYWSSHHRWSTVMDSWHPDHFERHFKCWEKNSDQISKIPKVITSVVLTKFKIYLKCRNFGKIYDFASTIRILKIA